ncbi:MAG: hypothetical protein ABIJ18_00600 [archaeon]
MIDYKIPRKIERLEDIIDLKPIKPLYQSASYMGGADQSYASSMTNLMSNLKRDSYHV